MFKNYFKIAFRNLWRHPGFSFINIMGLSVGMAACFLIFLYVSFELSYDSFHTKGDRIHRVVADIKTPTEVINGSGPSWAVPPNAKDEFPEIESFVRIAGGDNVLVRKGETKFQEENSAWADSALFKVFDFKLLRGNPNTALKEPFSVVFSESAAKKYFGNADPVGETLLLTGEGMPATVTGLMKDIPENSHIKADMIISMSTLTQKLAPGIDSQWGNYGASAYFLLKPGTDPRALERKFVDFLERRNGSEMKKSQMYATLFLEPLQDVYLRSTRNSSKKGNIHNVHIFSVVALFILLIACINFVNLTTARAAERAKEVGIRKVAGAEKAQLIRQFIGETVVLCSISFVLTLLLSFLLLPVFNQLAGKTVSAGVFSDPRLVALLFAASIATALLAGIYPALVLTSFKPITVLKGRFVSGTKGIVLRKGLVVAQFTISIALIIATIVVYQQMTFMRSRELGFKKDQVMVLDTNGDPGKEAFKQALAGMPNVKSAATSSSVPGGGNPAAYSEIENAQGDLQIANLDLYFVDFDYVPQYGIEVVAGRSFSRSFLTDTTEAILLNEAAIKMFGYDSPEKAIGRRFKQWGREGKIVGVVKDFHFRSLQQPIKPLSMRIEPDRSGLISVDVASANLPATIAAIEAKWKELIPGRPFSYYFLDEFFDRQYRDEARFGKLFLYFAILAIIISCLGLMGLSSYTTIQRTKEIGVRKVMGASVSNILTLLSKDFMLLVAISFFIAAPLAWYFMHGWLNDFAYRTGIGWWIFVGAGLTALLIALLTISYQAIRAAIANPVKSLRTE